MPHFISYLLSLALSFGAGSAPAGVAASTPIVAAPETPQSPPQGPKPPKEKIQPKPEEATWSQIKARFRS